MEISGEDGEVDLPFEGFVFGTDKVGEDELAPGPVRESVLKLLIGVVTSFDGREIESVHGLEFVLETEVVLYRGDVFDNEAEEAIRVFCSVSHSYFAAHAVAHEIEIAGFFTIKPVDEVFNHDVVVHFVCVGGVAVVTEVEQEDVEVFGEHFAEAQPVTGGA